MENILKEIQKDLRFLKTKALENSAVGGYINKTAFKNFFEYGDTRTAEILNSGELVISEVGRRTFIQVSSVLEYLEKHRKDQSTMKY